MEVWGSEGEDELAVDRGGWDAARSRREAGWDESGCPNLFLRSSSSAGVGWCEASIGQLPKRVRRIAVWGIAGERGCGEEKQLEVYPFSTLRWLSTLSTVSGICSSRRPSMGKRGKREERP